MTYVLKISDPEVEHWSPSLPHASELEFAIPLLDVQRTEEGRLGGVDPHEEHKPDALWTRGCPAFRDPENASTLYSVRFFWLPLHHFYILKVARIFVIVSLHHMTSFAHCIIDASSLTILSTACLPRPTSIFLKSSGAALQARDNKTDLYI